MCYCGLPVKAKGFCSKHYLANYRERKNSGQIVKTAIQEILLSQALIRAGKSWTGCGVVGCEELLKARGLCAKHYLRLLREEKKSK